MEQIRVGDRIKIIRMSGEPGETGKVGYVEYIDDAGQLHGSWSGLAIIPGEDEFEILGRAKDVRLVG